GTCPSRTAGALPGPVADRTRQGVAPWTGVLRRADASGWSRRTSGPSDAEAGGATAGSDPSAAGSEPATVAAHPAPPRATASAPARTRARKETFRPIPSILAHGAVISCRGGRLAPSARDPGGSDDARARGR